MAAQNGAILTFTGGPFSYVLIVDTTKDYADGRKGKGDDGFDVRAVGVSSVPLPAGAALLLTAMGGFAVARRPRKTA